MFSSLPAWIVWLILSGIFFVVEIFTVSFMMFWPGVAAFVASMISALGAPFGVQVTVFSILSIVLIIFTKPLTNKLFKSKDVHTNVDNIIGKTGTVTKSIGEFDARGQVKIAGELYTAISDETISENSRVKVIAIDGVKLKVEKI